jgi:hypothetical protein
MTKISYVLLILSFIAIALAGLLDITNQKRFMIISKEHLWADGIYLAVLAVFFYLYESRQ